MNGLTLEVLQVVIEAQTKPIRDELARLQTKINQSTNQITKKTEKIKSSFSKLSRFIASIALGAGLSKFAVNATNMAKNVEAATQQITMLLGENAQAFMRWGKQNALTLNMSQSDFLKFGSIYSNLLSSFISSTSGIASQTTNLLKASSIIASGTGRTIEDVMERIRSGLLGNTEAIEDLGINVNVAMLESTDAFKRFAGDNSWNQLDFQTQQQIRLFAILEQTSKKFGDSVLNNTNSTLAQLTAILKDIALNIGNALLPVLNAILPPIIAFANVVRTATSYLATFMSLLFGKKISGSGFKDLKNDANGASSAIGGINDQLGNTANNAKKTAKELDNLLGFDQITKIQDETSNGNNGSGGANVGSGIGGGIEWGDSFEEPDTTGVQKAVDKVKKILDGLKTFLINYGPAIISIVAGIASSMASVWLIYNWKSIFNNISKPLHMVIELFTFLGSSLKNLGLVQTIGGILGISNALVGVVTAIGIVVGAIAYLWQTNDEFRNKMIEAWNNVCSIIKALIDNVLKPVFDGLSVMLLIIIEAGIKPLLNAFVNFVDVVGGLILDLWNLISPYLVKFADWLGPILSELLTMLGTTVGIVVATIIGILTGLIIFITSLVEFIKNAVTWIIEHWDTLLEGTVNIITSIIQWFINLYDSLNKIVNNLVSIIFELWQGLMTNIITIVTNLINFIVNNFKIGLNSTITVVQSFYHTISNIFNGVKTMLNGVIDFIVGVFTGNWSRAWNGVRDIFSGAFSSLSGLIKAPLNAVIGIVNGAISSINRIGFDIPSWVPGIGGKSFRINIPKMQYLAQGGIVNGTTPAIIGEAGTEAVIPLKRNTQGIEMIANRLLEKMGGHQQTGDIYLTITLENGDVLTRYIIKNYNQLMQSTGGKGGFIW